MRPSRSRTASPVLWSQVDGLTCTAAEDKKGDMAVITLRVLDGADRGRVFADMPTPLTIGREEGNPIQLNDERISRFHLKIQEDQDKIVLTDLQSTNGTKLNGESVQLGMLRPGDVIALGRSLLLFGSLAEIAARLAALRGADLSTGIALGMNEVGEEPSRASLDFELNFSDDPDAEVILHTLTPPELPESLTPGQAAQLAELLQYLNLRMRGLLQSVKSKPKSERVTLDQRQWQNLLDLQDRLAGYLRRIGEPGE
jgi:pSer/pThr/pTyr-binding forkhead associated (FHA) protein